MKALLKKRGDYSHLNKHNLLLNLEAQDQHPITSIVDLEKSLIEINKTLDDVSHKIEYGDIGGNLGFVSRPKYTKRNTYDHKGTLIKEIYEGDLSKVVDYIYTDEGVLMSKVVTRSDGKQFSCYYYYDENGLLEYEEDNGTREEYVHTSGGLALYHTVKQTLSAATRTFVCDINEEFVKMHMGTIIAMELVIRNTHSTASTFFIEKDGRDIVTSNVESFNTQKYNLGISKDISVYVRGNVSIELNVSYIKNEDTLSGLNPDLFTMVKNIGNQVSRQIFRYDRLLKDVDNTEDSFTDLLEDFSNLEKVVIGGLRI